MVRADTVAATLSCLQCGMVVTISSHAREVKVVCPCGTRFEQSGAEPAGATPAEMGSFYLPRLEEVGALLCGDRIARCARKEYPYGLVIRGIDPTGEARFIAIQGTTIFDYGWLIERLGREALRAVEWVGSPDAFAKYVTSQYVVRTCHDEVQLLLQDDWRSFTMPPSDIQAIETAFTTFFAGLLRPEPEASS